MADFTAKAIRASFLKLLNEKSYGSITVKDIVTDCGINRNSFYYHYRDIPSLLEEIVREDCNRIMQSYPALSSIEDCLQVSIQFTMQNKRAVQHVYRSVDRAIYERYLWELCDYVVSSYLRPIFESHQLNNADADVLLRYYSALCFGQIMRWTAADMNYDIAADFRRLCEIKQGQLEEMLANCSSVQSY